MHRAFSLALATALLAVSGIASAHQEGPRWDHHDGPPPGRYRVEVYRQPRGYVEHRWGYGERLPPGYRTRGYYVTDYSRYGLYRPPAGHRWVRVNGDAVLVGVATGVVAASAVNVFYH